MSFLHLYLLGGLALIAVPVLVHLVTREKPKQLRFPAFRFLVQKYHTNRKKLRLHHLLLLLLRMLIIAAICLALARPLLYSERLTFLSGTQPVVAVLLFDTSPSMEYERGGLTRLADAKRLALELLDELPEGSRVAVLDSAERGGEFLDRSNLIRERIQSLAVRPANSPVTRQLDRAYQLLEDVARATEGLTEPPPRFLYVFSDRTRACWDGTDTRTLRQPEGINSVFVDVGADEVTDLAIDEIIIDPPSVPPGGEVSIRVVVRATGQDFNNKLICRLDNSPRGREKDVELREGERLTKTFKYRAAEADKPGSERLLGPGPHQVIVRFEGTDRLPFNNVRHATFVVRPGRKVLTILDRPEQTEAWTIALNRLGYTSDTISTGDAAEPEADLSGYDVVCLFQVAPPGGVLWGKLAKYVRDGGELAVIPGDSVLSHDILPGKLEEGKTASDQGIGWDWSYSNTAPFMATFLKWKREDSTIDFFQRGGLPVVRKYWRVTPAEDARIIARYAEEAGNLPALLEKDVGQGRVLLFTSKLSDRPERIFGEKSIALPWQNYWGTSFGLVLADLTCRYLAGDSVAPDWNGVCGQSMAVPLTAEQAKLSFTVRGPGLPPQGLALTAPPEKQGEQEFRYLPVSRANLPGNYTVYAVRGEKEAELLEGFSLNVRPEENQLAPRVAKEEVESHLGKDSVLSVDHGISLRDAISNKPQPLELLPWLMLLLLLILAAENLLANRGREPQPREDRPPGTVMPDTAAAVVAAAARPGKVALPILFWTALGAFAGAGLALLRGGGYTGVAAGAAVTGLLGAAHGTLTVARFGPRDGAILGGLLGSMVGVLYGWLILAGMGWLGNAVAVLTGTVLGAAVMAADGWFIGVRSRQRMEDRG